MGTLPCEPSSRSEIPALATRRRKPGSSARTSQILAIAASRIAHETARDLAEHLAQLEGPRHP